jgi:elongator complex protein 4
MKSAFKRKNIATDPTSSSSSPPPVSLPIGTRVSPASNSTIITSTGIASLDDVLGGGLPLSCSLLTLAPDLHSAYGELVLKYFIAQGIAGGQRVVVLDSEAEEFVHGCMWMPGRSVAQALREETEDGGDDGDEKVKIAWRYANMKRVQTTVNNAYVRSSTKQSNMFYYTERL